MSSRFFYQFLLGNERAVAQELREQYVETMSKIYLSYFKSYTSRLMKIQVGTRCCWGVQGPQPKQEHGWGVWWELSGMTGPDSPILQARGNGAALWW